MNPATPPGPPGRRTLIVGATGLVGRACLDAWAADPDVSEVVAPVRRAIDRGHLPPSVRLEPIDFARLAERADLLAVDHVVCALGTTLAQAGSREAFRAVDHDQVLAVARLARAQGARHFLLVSAVGADARSLFFYNRVKGEVEQALGGLGYRSLTIARPSFLLGLRAVHRPGEALGARLGVLAPEAYRPVHATQVAAALLDAARRDEAGLRVLDNRTLRTFARAERA